MRITEEGFKKICSRRKKRSKSGEEKIGQVGKERGGEKERERKREREREIMIVTVFSNPLSTLVHSTVALKE